ncbi:unnamed protein product [Peronospora belbahrii]|uniref:Uncharacterized protein n=1 Tax=Peronospora belbahrii TaxID=622444 RepID=A0AAU9LA28_9STRA|nr:unnamed protein product [Peronospora belbahrii]CAH0518179.1 unnamed protein product [Peronospora belbahrii]
MAARVTKLFLQNCGSASSKPTKDTSSKSKTLEGDHTMSKTARRKLRQKNKKVSSTSKVKVLEETRRELMQADRTAQNLRKLKSKVPIKSLRLMEKVLAQRNAAFR